MINKQFKIIRKEILAIIANSPYPEEVEHAKSTYKLVLQLKPSASCLLQIAALGHDIDRGVAPRIKRADYKGQYNKYKRIHSQRSAQIVAEILETYNISPEEIRKVKSLIKKHEVGGDSDSNILKDADSLSFFLYNLEHGYLKSHTRQETIDKIKWMYQRVTSHRAKRIINKLKVKNPQAKQLFRQAMCELEQQK